MVTLPITEQGVEKIAIGVLISIYLTIGGLGMYMLFGELWPIGILITILGFGATYSFIYIFWDSFTDNNFPIKNPFRFKESA